MPNLIITMIPEGIVAQYTQYYEEINFRTFSRFTMLCILSTCVAMVRKSLQVLDNIAADGAKAFNDLVAMVPKLHGGHRRSLATGKRN